jgi:phenylacetate-CoA ligase
VPLGLQFVGSLEEMQRVQWASTQTLLARSEDRLGPLLKHAAENVPYYQDQYRKRGLNPGDLRTINDLQQLPILAKSDYRQFEPEALNAGNVSSSLRVPRATSGSTGEPFQFSLDRRALPVIFASHLFYDSWYGFEPFDRYVRIMAPPAPQPPLPSTASTSVKLRRAVTTQLQSLYESLTQKRISLWEVNAEGAENIWRRIEAFRPKFVMGYTSSLAAIADQLLHRELKLSRPLEAVITIAETLSPNRKRLIDAYFNAPIINRYGLREFGSWSAQSCRESPDRFHINTELVVCEVLRPDGTPCAAGETGRVVLTDLHNFARPFIRYDTGDLAVAVSENCSCGRGFPLLGPIEGRSLDCLRTPSGDEISPASLGHFLFVYHDHLEAVRHYQLVQETANRVNLLVVASEAWNEERRERLRSDLKELLGHEMEVDVQVVDEIPPEKSGKRPIIKSLRQ